MRNIHKRGQGEIVTVVLIILLVLFCIGILWVTVRGIVSRNSEKIDSSNLNVAITSKKVELAGNQLIVTVRRDAGEGEMLGVIIKVINDSGSYSSEIRTPIAELETREYLVDLTDNLENPTFVEVYPIIAIKNAEDLGVKSRLEVNKIEGSCSSNSGCPGTECRIGKCDLVTFECYLENKDDDTLCSAGVCIGGECIALTSSEMNGLYNYAGYWAHTLPLTVIRDGDYYYALYSSGRNNPDTDANNGAMWYAKSSNGISWTDNQKIINKGTEGGSYSGYNAVIGPPRILKEGAVYRMWHTYYSSSLWKNYIAYSTSSNLVSWSPPSYVFSSDFAGFPNVVKVGSVYHIIYEFRYTSYEGNSYVYVIRNATSTGGISWSPQSDLITGINFGNRDGNQCVNNCTPQPYVAVVNNVEYPYLLFYNKVTGNGCGTDECDRYYRKSADMISWTAEELFSTEQGITTILNDSDGKVYGYQVEPDSSFKRYYPFSAMFS